MKPKPIIAAGLLALALALSCAKSTVTGPAETCCCDSLRAVIAAQEFIIGQQSRMIRCLQSGGTDCYGGI